MGKILESANVVSTSPGRMLIKLITPGQGSSGFYSSEVLEAAASDKVFPRGTQMHIDHDSFTESAERPEGSLRNLAAVLEEDAYVDKEGNLVAEALVSSAWRPFLVEFKDFIGASINAAADITRESTGVVIERLLPSPTNRVDFVTIAGRGGSILQVLESARNVAERSVVSEAFSQETDELLRRAVKDSYPGQYAWLVDHDETTVVVEVDDPQGNSVMVQRGYALSGGSAALDTDAVEVRRVVTYAPLNQPSETAGVQENAVPSKEDVVAKVEIEETELTQLREAASRVQTLEASDEERLKNDANKAQEARVESANAVIREAFGTEETPKLFQRIAESAAVNEDFDVEAFRTEVNEAAAIQGAESGAGKPRGLGETARVSESADTNVDDDSVISALHGKA